MSRDQKTTTNQLFKQVSNAKGRNLFTLGPKASCNSNNIKFKFGEHIP